MPAKWAVLVVHGVGDTGPGVTVDCLVNVLAANRSRLQPDGRVEIHQLPDMTPQVPVPSNGLAFFPVHIRRAKILPRPGAPACDPTEAVFAEVYWADLSTIREGTIELILSLLSTIFFLRFISDQAAVMPDQPATRSAGLTRVLARWLRFFLHLATFLICGPISALAAFLGCVLAVNYLVLFRLRSVFLGGLADVGMFSLSAIAALAGCLAWLYCSRRNSGSTWTQFWSSFALTATLAAMIVVWRQFPAYSEPSWKPLMAFVRNQLGLSEGSLAGIPGYAAVILFVIESLLMLLSAIVLVGLIVLAWSLLLAPKPWRAALAAAYGSALVQLGLWLLFVPPLGMIAVQTLLNDPASMTQVNELLAKARGHFVSYLLFASVVGIVAASVLVSRWRWVRRQGWLRSPPPYPFPTPGTPIDRLLVHALVIATIVGLATLGSGLVLADFLLKWLSITSFLGFDLKSLVDPIPIEFVDAVTGLLISALLILFGLSRRFLRDGLHIITDVINHFYRRRTPVPWPVGPEDRFDILQFETQQRIEHRFKTVLNAQLVDPAVTRLTVVAHSQGTVIAVDVFTLEGLTDPDKDQLKRRLGALQQFNLITMGSPLTHIYQHYFPFRYPSFQDKGWDALKGVIGNWVNIYRVDDYVGTFVEPHPGFARATVATLVPFNLAIGPGGHTRYWRRPEVFEFPAVRDYLPG
jgi:hypothetical protein